jgi:hypothetical protein
MNMIKSDNSIKTNSQSPLLLHKVFTRTSQGALNKAWYKIGKEVYLVKSGYKDEYNPFAEVIGSRIAYNITKGYAIPYTLDIAEKYPDVKGKLPYVCLCKKWDNISTVKFYTYIDNQSDKPVADYFQWLVRFGTVDQQYYTALMLFVDAIIGNYDRHLGNWELDTCTGEITKFIDFGNSLLATIGDRRKFKGGIAPDRAKPFDKTHLGQIKKVAYLVGKCGRRLEVNNVMKSIQKALQGKDIDIIKEYDTNYFNKVEEYVYQRAKRFVAEYGLLIKEG